MNRDQAKELRHQFEQELEKLGLWSKGDGSNIFWLPMLDINWGTSVKGTSGGDGWHVTVTVKAPKPSDMTKRVTNKRRHTALAPMLTQVITAINRWAVPKLKSRDRDEITVASNHFDMGWCAWRMGLQLRGSQATPHIMVDDPVRPGQRLKMDVDYHPKLDILTADVTFGGAYRVNGLIDVRVVLELIKQKAISRE